MHKPPTLSLVTNNEASYHDARCPRGDESSIAHLRQLLSFDHGNFSAQLGEARLHSAFQPIVGLCHERIVGYEGLLRATAAQGALEVKQLFDTRGTLAELIQLDRLSRLLHAINFSLVPVEPAWLFLNVHPEVFVHGRRFGRFFEEMLAISALPAHSLVIEVLESAIADEGRLAAGVHYYRQHGCLIALDDFGANSSNLDRVLRLQPDIVKLDRTLIGRAAVDATARRLLLRLVALLQEVGIMVVIEGIETEQEAIIALDSNAEFGQGYLFAKAGPLSHNAHLGVDFSALNRRLREERTTQQQQVLPPQQLSAELSLVAQRCAAGVPLQTAAKPLLDCAAVQRLYLLDGDGYERAGITPPHAAAAPQRQLAPLHDTTGANWSRRPHVRAALARPGVVQITPPYRSGSAEREQRTLSLASHADSGIAVLCCEIECNRQ